MLALVLGLILSFPPISPQQANAAIPKFRNQSISAEQLKTLLGNKKLILIHRESSPGDDGESVETGYITSVLYLDTAPENVRKAVSNYEKFPEYFTRYSAASQIEKQGSRELVKFNQTLNLGIIETSIIDRLLFEETDQGDIVFRHTKGDLDEHRGRWEFLPVPSGGVLVVLTEKISYDNLGWVVDTIFWAQPDLKRTLPVIRPAILLEDLEENLGMGHNGKSKITSDEPTIPKVFGDTTSTKNYSKLTDIGVPILVHPPRSIQKDNGRVPLRFVTTVARIDGPKNLAKEYLLRLEEVPKFIDQLETVQLRTAENGYRASWRFDIGFGILSVPLQYRVRYVWRDPDWLTFTRINGDFEDIYGAYEWTSRRDNRTYYALSSAIRIGDNAPTLVQMGKSLPDHKMFIGLSLGSVGVLNAVEWTEQKIRNHPDTSFALEK